MDSRERPVVTIILGAGASRDVSYAMGDTRISSDLGPTMLSPLDSDFFDLLQRLEARTHDPVEKEAMRRIIDKVLNWKGERIWSSMEKMFYSLHVSAVLQHKLFLGEKKPDPAQELVNDFLRSIRALLHEAHWLRYCTRHQMLFQDVPSAADAVLTFNYDFVAERALAEIHADPHRDRERFGDWFYGFSERPADAPKDVPTLYKLHGSLNWQLEEDCHGETQNARKGWPTTWSEFKEELSYSPGENEGYQAGKRCRPPVLLPYWDKRVEKGLWLKIWKGAASQLRRTEHLIVWGYSLPTTDLKARELLSLAFSCHDDRLRKVVVIDPSLDTRDRWRKMFLRKQFWGFESFDDYQRRSGTNLAPFR